MSDKQKVEGPLTFAQALAVLFVGLKLTAHIDWSWWWILSPLWIRLALSIIAEAADAIAEKKK